MFLESEEREVIHRRNLLFYLSMYAACEICSSVRPGQSQIESIDLSPLTGEWLKKPWQRVRKKYEGLAAKQLDKGGEKDYDKLAKGTDLLKAIQSDLRTRFGQKKSGGSS